MQHNCWVRTVFFLFVVICIVFSLAETAIETKAKEKGSLSSQQYFFQHPPPLTHFTTDLAEFEAWFKDQIADRSELDNLKVSLSLSLSTFLSLHVILFSFYPSVHRS
jgi:hypothetical protein